MSFDGELFHEIFSRLPAKYLCKFSSVCKSSFDLLTNDVFVKMQFKHMQLHGDTDYFIEPDSAQRFTSNNLEVRALCTKENMRNSLPPRSVEFLARNRILGSCNGLLCCRNVRDVENPLFLYNPTTRNYLSIPSPEERSIDMRDLNIIFQYCHKSENRTDDYLLMALVSPDDLNAKFHVKLFSPEENIWNDGGRVDLGSRKMVFEFSVYLNGVVYMVSDQGFYFSKEQSPFYWPYIVAYELKNSSSKFLEIPIGARKGLESSKLGIFKWGNSHSSFQSICFVRSLRNKFTIWVLETNQQRTNSAYKWNEVFQKHVKAMGVQQDYEGLEVVAFTLVNGRILLFATHETVYRYDLMDSNAEFECTHNYGERIRFTSYLSTLRPCGTGAITL